MDDASITVFFTISIFLTTIICLGIGALFQWALKKSKRKDHGIYD